MAARLRISRPYYCDLESGKKQPSEALAELARLIERADGLPTRGNVEEISGNYRSGFTKSAAIDPVIADPKHFKTDAQVAAALEELEEHFEALREVIREDPKRAAVVAWLMRKHLKREDLLE